VVVASRPVRGLLLVLGIALPWAWFLVRDLRPEVNALAVLLPALGVAAVAVLLLLAALLRSLWPIYVSLSVVAMIAVAILGPRRPEDSVDPAVPITIAFANVFDENDDPEAAADDLLDQGTDLIVAVETTTEFREIIEAADDQHPYELDEGQIQLHSAWPAEIVDNEPPIMPEGRAVLIRVLPPGVSPLHVLAVHAPNPTSATTFAAQTRQMDRLRRYVLDLAASGPVILVGDLNLSDRTSGYRGLDDALRDVMRANDMAHNTYAGGIWRFAMLRIDHLFVNRAWCASEPEVFAITGSDHRGLRATVGPCP
jgi:endonuclease/exonuclease/phosphatase (EEP) superfamily protein YafD